MSRPNFNSPYASFQPHAHAPVQPHFQPQGHLVAPAPDINVLARRLSQVEKKELQRSLHSVSKILAYSLDHVPVPVATTLVCLAAKPLQQRYEEVYVSHLAFDEGSTSLRVVSEAMFSYRASNDWETAVLPAVLRSHPYVLDDLKDVILLALEKYHPEPVLAPMVEASAPKEVIDRLARIEDSLRQQQSTTLTLATISGWLLRATPPSVWESGGADTVQLVGGLADAVSPWPDESPAAAEASLRAARAAGALIEGPGPRLEPSDAVRGWALNHPQQALELSRHLAELAGAASGDHGKGKAKSTTKRSPS